MVERFKGRVKLPGPLAGLNNLIEAFLAFAEKILGKIMFLFIIAGIVLSCLHQSSLGSLMLIASYKVHPLWYTPILPLLFLLSAFAAGYPMVTFESILVSKSFGRQPEMDVLTPLAKFMPLLMGIYLVFKIGDMMVRGTYVYLLDGTFQTNAFIVEVLFGVILPFVLLMFKRVRRSAGWLFFVSATFVLGILLNRINVFVVSYTPPYMIVKYFPALGEIFITVGLIATLMFVYRVFVFIFPVLGAEPKKMSTTAAAVLALTAALMILGTPSGAEADQTLKRLLPLEENITPSIADAPKVAMLNSPVVNKYSDLYGPVRFMHSKHANVLEDCTICHHRTPREERDTYGEPVSMAKLREMQAEPVACSVCHADPFNPKDLGTPGLKGRLPPALHGLPRTIGAGAPCPRSDSLQRHGARPHCPDPRYPGAHRLSGLPCQKGAEPQSAGQAGRQCGCPGGDRELPFMPPKGGRSHFKNRPLEVARPVALHRRSGKTDRSGKKSCHHQ